MTRVRWTQDGSQLISIGGADTSILVWDLNSSSIPTGRSIQRSNCSIQNIGKGESDDSATDSEDEGYDSDVKREKNINYFKTVFVSPIKRTNVEIANAINGQAAGQMWVLKSVYKIGVLFCHQFLDELKNFAKIKFGLGKLNRI